MRSTSCSSGSSPPLRRGALRFLLAILRDEDSDDAALISDDAALILGSAAEADNVDDDMRS